MEQFDVIGELIAGTYKVEAELGEGGMGTVYRARIVRNARPVAIKVLRKDVVGVEHYESRFAAEALMTARIKHANVVELIEHGYLPDGRPYLVLELLTGRSLGDILRTSVHIEWRRALAIIREAALGLGAVHAEEIVHRDLKPENIFLLPKRGGETVKIMDFGLAKSLGAQEVDMDLTRPGFAIGTPAYMAPERVTGDYDCRSDLYGLMVVAYQLLTGEPPFAGHGTEVLREHLTKDAPSLGETNKELSFPTTLEWLLAKSLAKDVDQRHQSAAELVRDIDHVLTDEHATLPTATPKLDIPTRRVTRVRAADPKRALLSRRVLLAGVGATCLVLLILGMMSSASDEPPQASPAVGAGEALADEESAAKQDEKAAQRERAESAARAAHALDARVLDEIEATLGTTPSAAPSAELPGLVSEARECRSSEAHGLTVHACVFASPARASATQSSSLTLASEVPTSVAVASGRALLWVADPKGVDPEGREIQSLVDSFISSRTDAGDTP